MTYQEEYNSLVLLAKPRGLDKSLLEGYFESHHIVPVSHGGEDIPENKVLLKANEHLRSHYLLCLVYKGNPKEKEKYKKSLSAYHAMLWYFNSDQKRDFDSVVKEFTKHRELLSEINSGENSPLFGKHLTDEHKEKISQANTGMKTWNTGKNMKENPELEVLSHPCSWKGKHLPKGARDKIGAAVSESAKRNKRHWFNNGVEEKVVPENEPTPEGFVKGRLPFTEESIEKLSKALKGRKVWNTGTKGVMKANSASFPKGNISWNTSQKKSKIKSVKRIKLPKKIKVYDVTVPDTHNFLLGNGVVVHNCMGSAVATHFGFDSLHVLGATKESTAMNHPMVTMATWFGAKFDIINIGYNHNLQLRIQEIKKQFYPDGYYLEYGITLDHKKHSANRILDFHKVGAYQTKNIPDGIKDLVIPCGSSNSSTSILLGLFLYPPKDLERVHLIGIGPTKYNYLMERLQLMGDLLGIDCNNFKYIECKPYNRKEDIFSTVEETPDLKKTAVYSLQYYDLHGTKYCSYQDDFKESLEDIVFHRTYEAKVYRYLKEYLHHLIKEDTLFWIIGSEPFIEKMEILKDVLGEFPTKIDMFVGEK